MNYTTNFKIYHTYCHNNWGNKNIDPWYVSKGRCHFLSIGNFERTVLHKFPENKEDTPQIHDDIVAPKSNCIVEYNPDHIYLDHKNFDNEFPSILEDIYIVLYRVHNVLHFYKDMILNSQFPSFHLKWKKSNN